MCTDRENTRYDSFLIIKDGIKKYDVFNEAECGKIAYKNNLLEILQANLGGDFNDFTESDMKDIKKFRKVVDLAYDRGYHIYQLTEL